MFSEPPDEEQNKTLQNNPRRRRIKSFKNKNKRKGKKKAINKHAGQNFATVTMSSWAESFTHAATWQLKHQIAYWKSKATALQYENRILHDIIRKNYLKDSDTAQNLNDSNHEDITENVEESQSSEDEDDNNEDLEVSEEFIQFLMSNAKYKEDAKRERERLKALQNSDKAVVENMEAMPTTSTENKEELLKELYGESWQRIGALETSVHSQFLSSCDQEKPEYWPNIPLNFNFS